MKRFAIAAMLAFATAPASAQIADAVGRPLPSSDLPPGTVTVKIVAGSPSDPIAGGDVTLTVNGTPRVARTDAEGRALFKDLGVGATVQAKFVDANKQEFKSEEFPLPEASGVKLLLSTKPFKPGGMAPFAGGGAGGMPEPRQMSGQPRPEQADAPGTYTVRLTYDDFKDAPPVGVPVTLIGYSAEDRVTVDTKPTDKDGRAQFTGLDRTGATAYYAMAELARGTTVDRLYAQPATLDPQTGVRLVLSSEKRSSTDPALDDLARIDRQDPAVPAGKVRIALVDPLGVASRTTLTLIDAATRKPIGQGVPTISAPDPTDIRPVAQFALKPDLPPGTLDIAVSGGPGSDNKPLADVSVKIAPASKPDAAVESKTADNGTVRIAMPPAKDLIATITVNGKALSSKPLNVTKSGGVFTVQARWPAQGRPELEVDVADQVGRVLYAEAEFDGRHYRSLPFQPMPDRGTRASVFLYPPTLWFQFSWTSHIDDNVLAVSGQFDVFNTSLAPYSATPDGTLIPLPKGFNATEIAQRDQGAIIAKPGEGFLINRPIAPGDMRFQAAFAVPVVDGKVAWSLELPYGAFESGMEIRDMSGMHVEPPRDVEMQPFNEPSGKFIGLPGIHRDPGEALTMTVSGVPTAPTWKTWLPRMIGIAVVVVMLGGLGFALTWKPRSNPARQLRREQLLDELVELERSGKNAKRREAVMAELESMWD